MASLAPLWKRNLRRTPLFTWGMVIAHLGVAVALAGMAAESAFTRETAGRRAAGRDGGGRPLVEVRFDGVEPIAGPNWTAIEGTAGRRDDGKSFTLRPQARTFPTDGHGTDRDQRGGVATRLGGQLYVVLGQSVLSEDGTADRWQLRLWWKPLVMVDLAGRSIDRDRRVAVAAGPRAVAGDVARTARTQG